MTVTHEVYQTGNVTDRHRQIARDLSTESLLQEVELLQWDRLKMLERGASADSIRIADASLQAMRDELDHRRRLAVRYQNDPRAPRWPDTASKRYAELQQTARDLKTIWPMARFVEVVMAVKLERRGRSLTGRCPLPDHDDGSPSFHVYPDGDRWHCYGCDRGGDIFDLTGLYFGISSFRARVQRVKAATPSLIGGVA